MSLQKHEYVQVRTATGFIMYTGSVVILLTGFLTLFIRMDVKLIADCATSATVVTWGCFKVRRYTRRLGAVP